MAIALGADATSGPRLRVPVFDAVVAAVLVVAALVDTIRRPGAVHPWADIAAMGCAGALVLRTRAPLVMSALAAGCLTAYALLPSPATPLWTFLTILLVCFSVGANVGGRRTLVALAMLLVAGYVLQLNSTDRQASDNTLSEIWISPLVIIGGPFLAGRLLRRSRRQTAELHRLSEELQAERAKHEAEAAEAERRRIARELHDVISHSVSLMVVQAGAAEQLLNGDGAAREAVHAVRETGKEALAELRRQLAVLREGEGGPSRSLPGLAEIPALVERSGGILTIHGTKPDDAPAGLALTVYRMVQEGLTNARRHAADSPVSVVLDYEAGCVGVTVEDEGGAVPSSEGAGQGLLGIRERVAMYEGQLEAGPRSDRPGWRLHARLPIGGRGRQ